MQYVQQPSSFSYMACSITIQLSTLYLKQERQLLPRTWRLWYSENRQVFIEFTSNTGSSPTYMTSQQEA